MVGRGKEPTFDAEAQFSSAALAKVATVRTTAAAGTYSAAVRQQAFCRIARGWDGAVRFGIGAYNDRWRE
jgi:hypothetical protein